MIGETLSRENDPHARWCNSGCENLPWNLQTSMGLMLSELAAQPISSVPGGRKLRLEIRARCDKVQAD